MCVGVLGIFMVFLRGFFGVIEMVIFLVLFLMVVVVVFVLM